MAKDKTLFDLQSNKEKAEVVTEHIKERMLRKPLYQIHRNLFLAIFSLTTTNFLIGIFSFLTPRDVTAGGLIFRGGFILLGLMGYYALFTNNFKLLKLQLTFGLAYNLWWAILFAIGPLFSKKALEMYWIVPIWFNFALLHLIALFEPPYQELTIKKNGK